MGWVHIDQNDYAAGFEAGYRAVKGSSSALPALPAQPATRAGMTPFLMGVRKGLKKAGIDVDG